MKPQPRYLSPNRGSQLSRNRPVEARIIALAVRMYGRGIVCRCIVCGAPDSKTRPDPRNPSRRCRHLEGRIGHVTIKTCPCGTEFAQREGFKRRDPEHCKPCREREAAIRRSWDRVRLA